MLVRIGAAPAVGAPTRDPVELLLACHVRIRDHAALARELATARGVDASLIQDAARDLERYHAIALPLHQEDEDASIRPRLEAAATSTAVREALARMGEEHAALERVVADLLPLWSALAVEPGRHAELAPRLLEPTHRLGELWEQHLAPEETIIFPAIRASLSWAEAAAIRGEIEARRKANLVPVR